MSKGLITYCWDTGGIFNFTTGKKNDKDVYNAIMLGAKDAVTGTITLKDKTLELFPNPFTSTFNLRVDHMDEIVRVSIFDMLGKQVETINYPENTSLTNLGSSLKPDMYIVQVNGVKWTKSFKIVKQ